MADGKFGDIINFDHEDRQIMNLMKYYGLAQYPGLASVIRKLGSDTISIKPKSKRAVVCIALNRSNNYNHYFSFSVCYHAWMESE